MKNLKKILLIIIVSLMFIPNVFASDGGEITNISCTSRTGGINNASHNVTVNGLNIKVDDVTFEDVDDYLSCDMTIKNNSNDDLSVDLSTMSNKTDDYISYSLTTDGENIVTQGNAKTYHLDIKYKKQYSESKTIDNNIQIKLSGDNNPSTINSQSAIIVLGLALVVGLVAIMFLKKKKKIASMLLIGTLLLTTTGVSALTSVTINIDNKIIIDTSEKYAVYYSYPEWLTEDEISNNNYYSIQNIEDSNCEEHFYYNSSTYNNYSLYIVTVKEGNYHPGDTVKVKDYESKYNMEYLNYFGESSNLLDKYDYYYWIYSNSDYSSLSFNGTGDSFTSNYNNVPSIDVRSPMSFTMPSHDVTFSFDGTYDMGQSLLE